VEAKELEQYLTRPKLVSRIQNWGSDPRLTGGIGGRGLWVTVSICLLDGFLEPNPSNTGIAFWFAGIGPAIMGARLPFFVRGLVNEPSGRTPREFRRLLRDHGAVSHGPGTAEPRGALRTVRVRHPI